MKETKITFNNVNNGEIEYIGVYSLLDELLEKIKKCTDINIIEKYCNLYEKIYKLTIDKEQE